MTVHQVYKKYMGSVDGLCGAFDGKPSNDRSLPGGRLATSIDEFGRAWAKPGLPPNACQPKVTSSEKQRRAWDLCNAITYVNINIVTHMVKNMACRPKPSFYG